MYAGTTLRQLRTFDAWFGAHQKIDRLARRKLQEILDSADGAIFPIAKHIIHFEGIDGPDGIKLKTPAQDEPWHFYDPNSKKTNTQLFKDIAGHHAELAKALQDKADTRASFHAAWLAHALVDGLTPAHHYPYDEELRKIRSGEGNETRTSRAQKVVMPGDSLSSLMKNNWAMWGEKGLLATHLAFEWGVALAILPTRHVFWQIDQEKVKKNASEKNLKKYYIQQAQRIASMNLYDEFYRTGWTIKLAKRVRKDLIPIIIETVVVYWYRASIEAKMKKVAKA